MEDNAHNILDIAVGVIILLSAGFALYRGFVRETLAIAGWVGAFFATIYLFPLAQPHARGVIESELIADLLAGGVIFVVTLSVLWVLTHLIVKKIRGSPLNVLDRSLGFLFGVARGVVIIALVYMVVSRAVWTEEDGMPTWVAEARVLPVVDYTAGLLVALVPEGTLNLPVEGFDQIQDLREENQALRREQEVERLSEPAVRPVDPVDPDIGYQDNERQDMQQLNESVVDQE